MPDSRARTLYEFQGFRVDPQQRLLFAGDTALPLPPRVFDTLLHFLERPGQLLTKNALMAAIWPNVIVEENSLNQNISMLRRVLGETPAEHRFIVTAPGRGYRFVAPVSVVASASPPPVAPLRQARDTVPAPTFASDSENRDQSIAVLPFANLTGDAAKEYFGDAIAAELIHTLSRIPSLRVAARTSTFAYKGRNADARGIARDLGVRLVLDGSIRATEDRVRVSAQLVYGDTGYHVWSHTLEREPASLFELQDELAREVTKALNVATAATAPPLPSQDLEAYHLYMQALSLSLRPSPENVRGAIQLLRAALARDARFARAASLLAIQYTSCVIYGFPVPNALASAESEAALALTLDPADGATQCAAGVVESLRGNWLHSEDLFRTADSLIKDPYTSGLRCVFLTQSVGHISRALSHAEAAFRGSPTQPIGARMLAAVHLFAGRDQEARHYCDASVELGQSQTIAPLPDIYGQLALRAGRYAEASAHFLSALPPRVQAAGGAKAAELLCAAFGNPAHKAEASRALNEMEASLQPVELDPPMRKRLLLWRTLLGELDAAYALLTRSLDLFAQTGSVGSAWGLLWLPEMKPFRRDARFQGFITRLRMQDYWRAHGPPDGCELRGDTLVSL